MNKKTIDSAARAPGRTRVVCAAAVLLILFLPGTARAGQQRPTDTDVIPVAGHEDVLVVDTNDPPARSERVVDKKFWVLAATLNTAMLLDTRSTFDALRRCDQCYEANPYAAVFVNRGPAVTFAAGQAFDVGIMVLAAKMRASRKPQIQKIWWVAPAVIAAIHFNAYRHNQQVGR